MKPRTRRDFVRDSLKLFTLGLTAPQFLLKTVRGESLASLIGSNKILVVIQLSGGNDGVNTIIPYGDGAYYDARPTTGIGIPDTTVLKIDSKLGFHPGLVKLKELYDQKKVAIINGAGYPNQSRSHFRGMEIWHTADPVNVAKNGWLGKFFDLTAAQASNPLKGINYGDQLPKAFNCDHCSIPAISNLNNYQVVTDSRFPADRTAKLQTIEAINSEIPVDKPFAGLLHSAATDALYSSEALKTVTQNYQTTVQYPNTGLANGLKFISQVINANFGTKVFYISTGGYDTHATQGGTTGAHNTLHTNFANAVEAFHRDLVEHGKSADVLMMVFSEFGRRVRANGSNGTDHGAAGPMFLIGDAVRGGLYEDYPSLTDLDSNKDLKMRVDFRSIYAEVLEKWLDADSKAILGAAYSFENFL
ncbi:MAG: DUF1501 domain-containing protein [Acidobacteriota bacterium]